MFDEDNCLSINGIQFHELPEAEAHRAELARTKTTINM